MTTTELKNKIATAIDQEWFENVSFTISYPVNEMIELKSCSAIYEYVNGQVDGWGKYDNLPNELQQCKQYYQTIKSGIESFVTKYLSYSSQQLNNGWRIEIVNHTNIFPVQNHLPFDVPEAEFLINIHKNYPEYFMGAYNSVLKINIQSTNSLFGTILGYEFAFKDHTKILERRNAERKSISTIRTDFLNYLSTSEKQLIDHINKADTQYNEHIVAIDELKSESENKMSDLEKTYQEKLKLEEPAKYWSDRAKDLKKQGNKYLLCFIGLVIVACLFLGFTLWNPPTMFSAKLNSVDAHLAVKGIILYTTILSLLVYCIRAVSKTMFSSFHLARDCEERYTLTYFYLSLIKDSTITDNERELIMQSLFSRADTGLLKGDSSPTMGISSDIISKMIGR